MRDPLHKLIWWFAVGLRDRFQWERTLGEIRALPETCERVIA